MWIKTDDYRFEVKEFSKPRETRETPFFAQPRITGYHISFGDVGGTHTIFEFPTYEKASLAFNRLVAAIEGGITGFVDLGRERE